MDVGGEFQERDVFALNALAAETRENFNVGRQAAQSPAHLAQRSATQRSHRRAIQNWKPSDLPSWLTRETYVSQIQPALASVPKSQIRSVLGVSEPYSSDIQAGRGLSNRSPSQHPDIRKNFLSFFKFSF